MSFFSDDGDAFIVGDQGWGYAYAESPSSDDYKLSSDSDENRRMENSQTQERRSFNYKYIEDHPEHFQGSYGEEVKRALNSNSKVPIEDVYRRIKALISLETNTYIDSHPQYFQGKFGEEAKKWANSQDIKELSRLEAHIERLKAGEKVVPLTNYINTHPEYFQGENKKKFEDWLATGDPKTISNVETHIENLKLGERAKAARQYVNTHPQQFQGKFGEDVNAWLNSGDPETVANVEKHISELKLGKRAKAAREYVDSHPEHFSEESAKKFHAWINIGDPKTMYNVETHIEKLKEKDAEQAGRDEEARKSSNRQGYDRARWAEAERLDHERVERELKERLEETKRESLYSPHASDYWDRQTDPNLAIEQNDLKPTPTPEHEGGLPQPSPKNERNALLQIRDLHRDIMDSGGDPTREQADRLASLHDSLTDDQKQYIADHLGFISGEETPEDERGDYGSHAEIDNSKGFYGGLDTDRLPSITKIEAWNNKARHEISNEDFQDLKNIEMELNDPNVVDALKRDGYGDNDILSMRDNVRSDIENLNRHDVKAETEVNVPLKVGYKFNPDTKIEASFDVGAGTKGVNLGGRDKVVKLGFAHRFGGGAKKFGRDFKTFAGTVGGAAKKLGAEKLEDAKQLGSRAVEGASAISRGIGSRASSGWEGAKGLGSRAVEGLKSGVSSGWKSIGGAGDKTGKHSIQQMISNMYKSWYSIPKEGERPPVSDFSSPDFSAPDFYSYDYSRFYKPASRSTSRSATNTTASPTPTASSTPKSHDQMIFEKDMQDVLKSIDPISRSTRDYISRSSQKGTGSTGSNKVDQTRLEFLNMINKEMNRNRRNNLNSWYNRSEWRPDLLPYLIHKNYNKNFHIHVRGM
jgi:hypothetical protein